MLNVSGWPMGPPFTGEDPEESRMLDEMAESAGAFVRSHAWAPGIEAMYFAGGVAGVFALFLVRFADDVVGGSDRELWPDRELWVVVGDLPTAYFVTDQATNARDAAETYCSLMEDWVETVRRGGPLDAVFPVEAAAMPANADALAGRLRFIRRNIVPIL